MTGRVLSFAGVRDDDSDRGRAPPMSTAWSLAPRLSAWLLGREAEAAPRVGEGPMRPGQDGLALALDSGVEGIWDWDFVTGRIWVSRAWLARLGYAGDTVETRQPMEHIIHPDDRDRLSAVMIEHIRGATLAFECEHRVVCSDGSAVWVLTRGRVVDHDPQGLALRAVGTQIDITHRREAEARVAHMALHDDLTGLPNRRLFRQRLEQAVAQAEHGPHPAVVLACDLDGFKVVNDTLGHEGGDRLLCVVAERLRRAAGASNTVARLGGDEFAVVLQAPAGLEQSPTGLEQAAAGLEQSPAGLEQTPAGFGEEAAGFAEADAVAARIIAALGEPIEIDGMSVAVGVGIGSALAWRERISADALLRRADIALYEAKTLGRDTYRRFAPALAARHSRRQGLAFEMKEAIRRGDFFLAYQPVVDVATDTVTGCEALMRWRHPEHGVIAPAEFIPVAEETGLIVALGSWALIEACREAMAWPEAIRVAVNVSPVQVRDGLEQAVRQALDAAGLSASRLRLEVTESALMKDPEAAVATLHRLRAQGVKIALDDFGTGYASLSYLRHFPFDEIKIDRTFIRDIAEPDAAAIVRAVVGLGDRLGMAIVAEGVETSEQLERVRGEGCSEVQGFLFSQPLTPEAARDFLRADRARAAA
ncbi:EAL domain-containing protein [Methylobacterium sp. Leaf117]|uniref:putative bifunctional diguanylate cyclase/phosphodiesterase n=1 Tax=Methylobacterium sp. Leaf117 TaxID=1736260 RepID=UPI0006FA1A0D|nr:EAL domain-containing protein [Methylobacterium sp. Leaf117]KQP91995.1 hypothetical protein ASF57_05825 [Methylobacterium sp. Leaf117]